MFPNIFWFTLALTLVETSCLQQQGLENAEGSKSAAVVELKEKPVAALKQKRNYLLRDSLAKILVLHPQGMCMELGKLPCADLVHRVSLGGMNAYGNAQYRYPEDISVTSPMSLDRLVLSACIQRSQLDLLNPASGIIFKGIKLSADGRLVKNEAVVQSIQTLYHRGLLRDASEAEVAAILTFYEEIFAEQPLGAAVNWMILSCYSVLTSTEAAFY